MADRKLETKDTIRVVTSNNFLRAAGLEHASLKARKLLYIAIAQCRKKDHEFFEYKITIKDFASLMGIASTHVYQEADKITDELMKGFIKYAPDGKNFKKFQLFRQCAYDHEDGIEFVLSEDMTPVLLGLKRDFSQPLLDDFLHMRSNYSIEIWHLMQKEMHSKKPKMNDKIKFYLSLEELRRITGTENKFKQIGQFKERVLDQAIREIEERELAIITYENRKDGRKIIGFDFTAVSCVGDLDIESLPNDSQRRIRRAQLAGRKIRGEKLSSEEEDELSLLKEEQENR